MGYYMESVETQFDIDACHIPAVLDILDKDPEYRGRDIQAAFRERGYDITTDEDGNVDGIWFIGGKLIDDLEMFQSISEYVQSGSFLIMKGEDGFFWKWVFVDGVCSEIEGDLSFDQVYYTIYEVVETQKHIGNNTWSQTTTLNFRSAEQAFRYVETTHERADSVEPMMCRELDTQNATQIGYIFTYAPLRESSSSKGDEISVTIRRVTRSSPIEERIVPRLPCLKNTPK